MTFFIFCKPADSSMIPHRTAHLHTDLQTDPKCLSTNFGVRDPGKSFSRGRTESERCWECPSTSTLTLRPWRKHSKQWTLFTSLFTGTLWPRLSESDDGSSSECNENEIYWWKLHPYIHPSLRIDFQFLTREKTWPDLTTKKKKILYNQTLP